MSKLIKDIKEANELVYEDLVYNFNNCDCVKYSAYRTASKLHLIQRFLWFDHITIEIINGILTKHRVFASDNRLFLHIDELRDILYDVYFISLKDLYNSNNIRIDVLMNLCIKFLQSAFEQSKKDYFKVLDVKIALVSLCSCSPQQKFKYWFSQLVDHNLCLSNANFKFFLESLLGLAKYLSESKSFCDHTIESTLSSFETQFSSHFGISEVDFHSWLSTRPYFLSWLVIYYRFCSTKNLSHNVKCAHCQMNPIIGLRYCCLECLSYNLCQTCFFSGKSNKNHKTNHKMHEYCYQVSACKTTSAYIKTFVKRLCSQRKNLGKPEITSQNSATGNSGSDNSVIFYDNLEQGSQVSYDLDCSMIPSDQLNDIITQIEKESRILCKTSNKEASEDLIHRHTVFLQEQIKRLRGIQRNLEAGGVCMSTPMSNANESLNLSLIPRSSELLLSHSDFSSWLKTSNQDATQAHLQADLDSVLIKLNKMLENSFWDCN